MKIKTLQDLFETGLKYTYDSEQKLVKKGIPSMIKASSSSELRSALEQHLEETRGHVSRLEQVFSLCGFEVKKEDNDVVDELIDGADDLVSATEDGTPLRDAALIVSGNEVEHHEMAVYGSLIALAQQLGHREAATLLEQTLNEEKAADAKLTAIGERSINPRAAQELRAA
jgi:ferritin-like metal-binding protein YciE